MKQFRIDYLYTVTPSTQKSSYFQLIRANTKEEAKDKFFGDVSNNITVKSFNIYESSVGARVKFL